MNKKNRDKYKICKNNKVIIKVKAKAKKEAIRQKKAKNQKIVRNQFKI